MKLNLKSMVVNIIKQRQENRQICKQSFLFILFCHYKLNTSCFHLLPMEIIVMIFKFVLIDLPPSTPLELKI